MAEPGYSKGYAAGLRRATRTVQRLRAEVQRLRARLAARGQPVPDIAGAWVCPWGLCDHDQAQECRAEQNPHNGCGGRFPPGTTLEQAKEMIGPIRSAASGCEGGAAP